jgi:nucleoside-diphosphate-sugar epimerase
MNIGVRKTFAMPDGQEVTIETGKLAKQAHGSVVITMGGTMLLAAVVSNEDAKEGVDFLPLTVEYQEKYGSAGRFPGGFFKREARPSENEILICRLVDRIQPQKFVAISSACIYPQSATDLITESMIGNNNYHPSVKYSGMSKTWLLNTMETMDTPWEYLVISNAYGPGEPLSFEKSHFVGSLFNKIKSSTGTINMLGTGIAVRDFIYIQDVAESVCRYCELATTTQSPTNISTGQGTSISDITKTILNLVDPTLKLQWGSEMDNGVLHKILDNSKMYTDINFQPEVDLQTGLSRTWDWIKTL